jgi:hypothetical protein
MQAATIMNVKIGVRRLGLRSRIGSKTRSFAEGGDNGTMDATTDLDLLGRHLDELEKLDPAMAADLASRLADELAGALDALEERPEA